MRTYLKIVLFLTPALWMSACAPQAQVKQEKLVSALEESVIAYGQEFGPEQPLSSAESADNTGRGDTMEVALGDEIFGPLLPSVAEPSLASDDGEQFAAGVDNTELDHNRGGAQVMVLNQQSGVITGNIFNATNVTTGNNIIENSLANAEFFGIILQNSGNFVNVSAATTVVIENK